MSGSRLEKSFAALKAQKKTALVVYLTVGEVTKPQVEWAEEAGISRHTLRHRLRRGVAPEKAIQTHLD